MESCKNNVDTVRKTNMTQKIYLFSGQKSLFKKEDVHKTQVPKRLVRVDVGARSQHPYARVTAKVVVVLWR